MAGRQGVGQLEAAPQISMAGAPQKFPVPSGGEKQRWWEAAEWAPILAVTTSQWGDRPEEMVISVLPKGCLITTILLWGYLQYIRGKIKSPPTASTNTTLVQAPFISP